MKEYLLLTLLLLLAVNPVWAGDRKIVVLNDGRRIEFELNNTSAAVSLWGQLPLEAEVSDYGDNEKIFYPSGKLDTAGSLMEDCPAGTLAYFAPWGNVVMYYGPAPRYNGLYVLGHAVSGGENIQALSGKIQIEKSRD